MPSKFCKKLGHLNDYALLALLVLAMPVILVWLIMLLPLASIGWLISRVWTPEGFPPTSKP